MSDPEKTRFLHVANGTCTTDGIKAAAIPGIRSIWADPLYEGPVPGGLSDDELLDVRARYLGGSGDSEVEAVNDLRRWREIIEAHESYDELVLWFEHDLFDQLNLIQLLSWMRGRLPAGKPVSLICIGSFPGRPAFKGLGELSPNELSPLFAMRRRVEDLQYVLAEHAWDAFRQPTPEALDRLRSADTDALPFLAPAIDRFLQEYPSTTDGLSRSERRLLRLAEKDPIDIRAAFPRMHEDERAYYITDASLASLVETLSRTSPPLVTVKNGAHPGSLTLQGTIDLTDAGRQVLAGRRDRVACGLDRWLGGVHLRTGTAVWRWDDHRRHVTKH